MHTEMKPGLLFAISAARTGWSQDNPCDAVDAFQSVDDLMAEVRRLQALVSAGSALRDTILDKLENSNRMCREARAELARERQRAEAAGADSRRLDWLAEGHVLGLDDKHRSTIILMRSRLIGTDIRAAIDAAMREADKHA